jgi:hypothetical protein
MNIKEKILIIFYGLLNFILDIVNDIIDDDLGD